MRSSALFTVFVVGAASVASAEPKQEETSGRVSYTENADSATADEPRQPSDWVELASATPSKHGTEYVMVGSEAGAFSQLRIDAVKGRTEVNVVKIVFTDNSVKKVRINKMISKKRGTPVVVDLETTKPIDHLEVSVNPGMGGDYAVYGTSGTRAIATR
jgi:hypothetical protein